MDVCTCVVFGCFAEGLVDVIVYSSPDDPSKFNRGFAFLDYDSHKTASAARRAIASTRLQVWGSEVIVEWAEPQEEPDAETMSKVVSYVHCSKRGYLSEELMLMSACLLP